MSACSAPWFVLCVVGARRHRPGGVDAPREDHEQDAGRTCTGPHDERDPADGLGARPRDAALQRGDAEEGRGGHVIARERQEVHGGQCGLLAGKTRRCPLQTRLPLLGGHFGRVLQSVVNRLCVFLGVQFYRKISALHTSVKLAREPQTGLPLAAGSVDLRK